MITEYVVPSLALNYPCKEYQIIYESVQLFVYICMKCSCTSHIEGDQFLNSQHA